MQCKTPGCGSYAINDGLNGRAPGVDLDLCDVCYWRRRAQSPYAHAAIPVPTKDGYWWLLRPGDEWRVVKVYSTLGWQNIHSLRWTGPIPRPEG